MKDKQNLPINVPSFELPDTNITFFTPESDLVFRAIFGTSGNEHITKSFLEGILNFQLEDFSLNANPEFTRKHITDKKQTTDVKAICQSSKNIILIEMQNKATKDVPTRFTSYCEKAHIENLKKNFPYENLPKVMLIVLLAENLPELEGKENYYSVFNDRDKECPKHIFCDGVTKHVFESPKYINSKDKGGKINPWLEFLINPLGEEVKKAMRSIRELREAVEKLRELNDDDEVREIYEAEQWDRYVRASERNAALKEGEAIGRAEGEAVGRAEAEEIFAINMFKNNISIEDIAKISNMDIERVKEILIRHKLEVSKI